MSRKAARAGFDWERPEQVVEKVEEEIAELKEAMADGQPDRLEHELGDTLLALANLARFLRIDPEVAMIAANDRFERRFREMEKIAAKTGISIEQSDMRTLDRLWELAKRSTSSER
jgi:ATP diphosphatase